MSIFITPEMADLEPCPWCENETLFYLDHGAVCCDCCQAEGPFCGGHFDGLEQGSAKFVELFDKAVRLWNARGLEAITESDSHALSGNL